MSLPWPEWTTEEWEEKLKAQAAKRTKAVHLGGPGSGHKGHAGVVGQRGGSAPGSGDGARRTAFAALITTIAQPDAGFTAHAVTGERPTTGYAVSTFKGREKVMPLTDVTVEALMDYAVANWDVLSQPDKFFGGWHNPADGQVYLDVSEVTQDQAEAERLAQAHHQIGYFDFSTGQSVETPVAAD